MGLKAGLNQTLLLALAFAAGFGLRHVTQRPVTTSSLSPDGKKLASIVEISGFWDRNFEVRLRDLKKAAELRVFRSPDEGKPPGTERLVWSADGERFLLLGRRFLSSEALFSVGDEQAYLLMDVTTGKVWCNARQQRQYPPFRAEELRDRKWPALRSPP